MSAWILHWDFHQLLHDPAHLYQAPIFYPSPYVLTFSENLLGVAVFAFPLFALGVSTLAVYNILFLLGMFLSAMAAWALARWVTGDAGAALLAGLIYAFLPWRFAQLAHLQFQWGAFLCLLLLFLLRYLDQGRRRDAALFGFCLFWNALCNVHYALFSGLLLALVIGWELLTGGSERVRRVAAILAISTGVGCCLVPIFLPYWKASALYGVRRSLPEIHFYSGRPIDFLRAGWMNRLYGGLGERWPHPETEFFVGVLPLTLMLLALFRLPRQRSFDAETATADWPLWRSIAARACDLLILLSLATFVYSFFWRRAAVLGAFKTRDPGRVFVVATCLVLLRLVLRFPSWMRYGSLSDFLRRRRLPRLAVLLVSILVLGASVALGARNPYYRFLVQSAGFLFGAIRVPARAIVLFDLAVSVLAAWGLSLATAGLKPHRARAAMGIALVAVAFEYRAFPLRVDRVDPEPAPIYRWLASQPSGAAVMEWPLAPSFDAEYVFRSPAHWKPLVNGVSGFYPPGYVALADALSLKPIASDIWKKVPAGTGILILHAHDLEPETLARYSSVVSDAIAAGRIRPAVTFVSGKGFDHAFRIISAVPGGAGPDPRENEHRIVP